MEAIIRLFRPTFAGNRDREFVFPLSSSRVICYVRSSLKGPTGWMHWHYSNTPSISLSFGLKFAPLTQKTHQSVDSETCTFSHILRYTVYTVYAGERIKVQNNSFTSAVFSVTCHENLKGNALQWHEFFIKHLYFTAAALRRNFIWMSAKSFIKCHSRYARLRRGKDNIRTFHSSRWADGMFLPSSKIN